MSSKGQWIVNLSCYSLTFLQFYWYFSAFFEIIVGDMLVIDDGADEGVTIVVYHTETNSDSGDGTVIE